MAKLAPSEQRTCFQCSSSFEWPRSSRGPAKRYCPACVRENNRRRGAEFTARNRVACGKAKRGQGSADHRILLMYAIRRFVLNPKLGCAECGIEMMMQEARGDRCSACADVRSAAILRTSRSARKHYLKQFKFDPYIVLERDKWKCYLCGCDTPKALRGTMKPNAPEVDHVIPISRGGVHSEANTRCACRHCNNQKKSKTPDEYREWIARKAA